MTVQSSIIVYYGTPQGAIRQELLRKLLIGLWWNSIFFSTEASLECCHFSSFSVWFLYCWLVMELVTLRSFNLSFAFGVFGLIFVTFITYHIFAERPRPSKNWFEDAFASSCLLIYSCRRVFIYFCFRSSCYSMHVIFSACYVPC